MSAAVRGGLAALENDPEVRAVLVRGAGERAFCAGTDLNTLDDFPDAWAWRNGINYALEFGAFRKPLIVALKVWVFGGGFESPSIAISASRRKRRNSRRPR
jgi:enoyl-CoA hydratase/carnithine racemase